MTKRNIVHIEIPTRNHEEFDQVLWGAFWMEDRAAS